MSVFVKIGASEYNAADYSIPAERTFREAWQADGDQSVISVNIDKARDIWRDKIREARKAPLEALDTDYMRALETGSSTAQIVDDKQALRDAPALASIDAATTPEQLTEIQPIPNIILE